MTDEPPHSEYTLHVVLATFPQTQEKGFDENVREEFYALYRKDFTKFLAQLSPEYGHSSTRTANPVLYNPLSYLVLGNYDIAYVSLIDAFKFAQRLFEPELSHDAEKKKVDLFAPHTFQSFTGFTPHTTQELEAFFFDHVKADQPVRRAFLGICNLKLNNGFLIGNGRKYLDAVITTIKEKVAEYSAGAKVEYLLLQSFSWFDLSLLLFSDDPQLIADIIQQLRRLKLDQLAGPADGIILDSLYHDLFKKECEGKAAAEVIKFFKKANVFADTHTYLGIHNEVFGEDTTLLDAISPEALALETNVNWQVKPGHMHRLLHALSEIDGLGIRTDEPKYFLPGKSDYCLASKLKTLKEVIRLYRAIINGEKLFFEDVRKIKTEVFFRGLQHQPTPADEKRALNLHEKLKPLAETMTSVAEINHHLKALKISRQIRSKVLKIFSNYNNGVQDIILFPYLLDFKIFMERLKEAINTAWAAHEDLFSHPLASTAAHERDKRNRIEDTLMEMIPIFQEGFNIRMLNPYQFEDINDFDLDFNGSIQQLLSIYSNVAFEIGNLAYLGEYQYGPVIQLNLKDTVSNLGSINYYIHHLTSPEFVFATLTKEIINAFPEDDKKNFGRLITLYEKECPGDISGDPVLKEMNDRGLIKVDYFFNDGLRYVWTYHMQFDLYYYWFWMYNFQNSSLYSEMGVMNENHFQKELFRVLFIAKFFYRKGTAIRDIYCPLPELECYWDRHLKRISEAVTRFIKILDDRGVTKTYVNYLHHRLNFIMEKELRDAEVSYHHYKGANSFSRNLAAGVPSRDIDPIDHFFSNLLKRCAVFEKPPGAHNVPAKYSTLWLEWYMLEYLRGVYRLNRFKITLLRRDWRTGAPLRSFAEIQPEDVMYAVDQTGGLFFNNVKQQNLYFRHTAEVLLTLWDYAMNRKKTFISKKTGQ